MAIDWRLDMRLKSHQVLVQYMNYRQASVRLLADKVGGPQHRSTIGHLRSGARKNCNPDLARRIEEALQAPPGLLFDPQVSRVTRDSRTTAAAA